MSPARQHRERQALAARSVAPDTSVASGEGGGRDDRSTFLDSASLTPARQHRIQHAAARMVETGADTGGAGDGPAAQVMLRLVHDLRRLKEIQSIERKIEAKRQMIPEYVPWISALLRAAKESGEAAQDEVLPTIMIWLIDVGQFEDALELVEHVLAYDIALPSRYARTAPALIAEEIAGAALKAQLAGEPFSLDILETIELLTDDSDMHDEIRAKLQKAIGFEQAREAEALDPTGLDFIVAVERALIPLRRAQQLHERAGAKDRIRKLEKLLATARAAQAEKEQAGKTG
jgi:hypothetical protein